MNEYFLSIQHKLSELEEKIAQHKISIQLSEIVSDDLSLGNDRYKKIYEISSLLSNESRRQLIIGIGNFCQGGFYLNESPQIDLIIDFFLTLKELREEYKRIT